jgi:exoribonuclease-2
VVKDDLVRLEEIPLLLHVPALGVHARGTRLLMEVMSIDELTVEASVRMLHVLDAPAVTSGAEAEEPEEADEGEEVLLDAADDSAESEAEAEAEAEAGRDPEPGNDGGDGSEAEAAPTGQHVAEPGQ